MLFFLIATHCKAGKQAVRFWWYNGRGTQPLPRVFCSRKCCCSLQVWMDSWATWILTRRDISVMRGSSSMEACCPPFFPLDGWFWVRKFRRSKQKILKVWQFGSKQFVFSVFSSKQFNMLPYIVPLFFIFFRTGRLVVNWIILTLQVAQLPAAAAAHYVLLRKGRLMLLQTSKWILEGGPGLQQ